MNRTAFNKARMEQLTAGMQGLRTALACVVVADNALTDPKHPAACAHEELGRFLYWIEKLNDEQRTVLFTNLK